MSGGGPKYEEAETRMPPSPDELLLDVRKERIEEILRLRTRSLTVVLDQLEDTFNMAAVLRTCEAMGLQEVHVVENPKVSFRPNAKVTQGCDKWVDVSRWKTFEECLSTLKARGFAVWASAAGEAAHDLYSLPFRGKVALVFGNERFGVSEPVTKLVDLKFWIPMRGFSQSLNVSAAVSATLTRAVSWRVEHQGVQGDLSAAELADLRERFRFLSVKQRRRIYGPSSAE